MYSIVRVLLCAMVFVIPWEEWATISGIGTIAKLVGYITLGCAVLAVAVRLRIRRIPAALAWLGLFTAWSAISLAWSVRSADTLISISTYVAIFLFAWMVWEFCPAIEHQLWLWRFFLMGFLVTMISLFYAYVFSAPVEHMRYTGGGANQNDAAITGALLVPVAVYLASRQTRKRGFVTWMYWAFVPAALVAVLLTGSRTGLITLAVAIVLLVATLLRAGWKAKVMLVATILLGAFLVVKLVPSYLIERVTEGAQARTLGARQEYWQAGLRQWVRSPLLGYGSGTFRYAVFGPLGGNVAHNIAITHLVEVGFVGFMLYAMAVLSVARSVWRMPAKDRPYWAACLAVGLVSATVTQTGGKLTYFLFGSLTAMSVAYQASRAKFARLPRGAGIPLPPRILRRPNLGSG
jgi:O-antigen ligase